MTAPPETAQAHQNLLGEGALVPRCCPICGSDLVKRVFAEASFTPSELDQFAFASRKLPEYMHYRIVACECDLLYSSPIPRRELLESAYRQASFDASDESRLASVTYGRLLRGIVTHLPDRAGALDIGTGDGAFLRQLLKQGFADVVGVEPSTAPVALAAPDVAGLIRQAPFRASDFEASRFRLITCFQTMEHVDDPLGLCRDTHTLLKHDGALLLVCHNHRALSARVMGLKSPIFDIEHLQLFSPKSIRRALEIAGFSDVRVHPIVNRYSIYYLAKLAPLPRSIKVRLLEKLKAGAIGRILVSMPVGNMAAIGYKRP